MEQKSHEDTKTVFCSLAHAVCIFMCVCCVCVSKDAERLGDELSLQRMKSLSESQRALELERKLFSSERQLKQVTGHTALTPDIFKSKNRFNNNKVS